MNGTQLTKVVSSALEIKKFIGDASQLVLSWPFYYFLRYGWWHGKDAPDICASITNVTAQFWLEHEQQCIALLYKEAHVFIAYFYFGLYLFFYVMLIVCCLARACRLLK